MVSHILLGKNYLLMQKYQIFRVYSNKTNEDVILCNQSTFKCVCYINLSKLNQNVSQAEAPHLGAHHLTENLLNSSHYYLDILEHV